MQCTYVERRELVVDIQDVLDGVAHGADDPVDDVHHTVCGHLVAVDDPGAVHCHDLRGKDDFRWNRYVSN